jgi:hypothetical protein
MTSIAGQHVYCRNSPDGAIVAMERPVDVRYISVAGPRCKTKPGSEPLVRFYLHAPAMGYYVASEDVSLVRTEDDTVSNSTAITQDPSAPSVASSSARYALGIGRRESHGAIALARRGICF